MRPARRRSCCPASATQTRQRPCCAAASSLRPANSFGEPDHDRTQSPARSVHACVALGLFPCRRGDSAGNSRARRSGAGRDRKSVVEGKGGEVRVNLGGRRIIKKKKT